MAEPTLRVEYVPTASLVAYANNSKLHTDEQIDQIARSIERYGNCDPVGAWHDVAGGGTPIIVEGHGRVLALKRLGVETCPVIWLDHLSDEERREYSHVHNQLTMNTGMDAEVIAAEMAALPDLDWEAMGFGEYMAEAYEDFDEKYTRKVDTPVYEVQGDDYEPGELYDAGRYEELLEAIEASDVPEDEKRFLRLAAARHVVIDYGRVAEHYAHADAALQRLMEDSALVIVDYDRAIELGYVRLTTRFAEQMSEAMGMEDAE